MGRLRRCGARFGGRSTHGRLGAFLAEIEPQVEHFEFSGGRAARRPRGLLRAHEEARVLLGGPVGHAQGAPLAERAAGAHEHAALQPGPASSSSSRAATCSGRLAEGEPAEVGLRLRRRELRARAGARPLRCARRWSRDAIVTASWWESASTAATCASALQKKGWRIWSSARARSSEPQSANPIRRPQSPYTLEKVRRSARFGCSPSSVTEDVGIVEDVELAVGLVDDHADVAPVRPRETRDVIERAARCTWVVRVATIDKACGDGDLAQHRIEVVAAPLRRAER